MPYLRRPLSGAADGRGVEVVATATAGTTIHTAQADATLVDVLTLYATNTDATRMVSVTLEWGGVSVPDDNLIFDVPPRSTVPLVPDLILRNSLVLKAFATVASVIAIHGFVNRES